MGLLAHLHQCCVVPARAGVVVSNEERVEAMRILMRAAKGLAGPAPNRMNHVWYAPVASTYLRRCYVVPLTPEFMRLFIEKLNWATVERQ